MYCITYTCTVRSIPVMQYTGYTLHLSCALHYTPVIWCTVYNVHFTFYIVHCTERLTASLYFTVLSKLSSVGSSPTVRAPPCSLTPALTRQATRQPAPPPGCPPTSVTVTTTVRTTRSASSRVASLRRRRWRPAAGRPPLRPLRWNSRRGYFSTTCGDVFSGGFYNVQIVLMYHDILSMPSWLVEGWQRQSAGWPANVST